MVSVAWRCEVSMSSRGSGHDFELKLVEAAWRLDKIGRSGLGVVGSCESHSHHQVEGSREGT